MLVCYNKVEKWSNYDVILNAHKFFSFLNGKLYCCPHIAESANINESANIVESAQYHRNCVAKNISQYWASPFILLFINKVNLKKWVYNLEICSNEVIPKVNDLVSLHYESTYINKGFFKLAFL
jgi:hypothetical protein